MKPLSACAECLARGGPFILEYLFYLLFGQSCAHSATQGCRWWVALACDPPFGSVGLPTEPVSSEFTKRGAALRGSCKGRARLGSLCSENWSLRDPIVLKYNLILGFANLYLWRRGSWVCSES